MVDDPSFPAALSAPWSSKGEAQPGSADGMSQRRSSAGSCSRSRWQPSPWPVTHCRRQRRVAIPLRADRVWTGSGVGSGRHTPSVPPAVARSGSIARRAARTARSWSSSSSVGRHSTRPIPARRPTSRGSPLARTSWMSRSSSCPGGSPASAARAPPRDTSMFTACASPNRSRGPRSTTWAAAARFSSGRATTPPRHRSCPMAGSSVSRSPRSRARRRPGSRSTLGRRSRMSHRTTGRAGSSSTRRSV